MEQCPRPECDGTLVVEQVGGGKEVTCRACGRQPHSPPVNLPPTPSLGFAYAPPWVSGQQRRDKDGRFVGKRKSGRQRQRGL